MYGTGKQLGKDYFETKNGVKMFFYDSDSVKYFTSLKFKSFQ